MEFLRSHFSYLFPVLGALVAIAIAVPAWALEPSGDGYFHTGVGVRVKKVAFVSVKVYEAHHAMKALPSSKSKQAIIDADCDKKIEFKMLRDVDAEKMRNAMREGFGMNGYTNPIHIVQFTAAFTGEVKEGQWVKIHYDAKSKATTIHVEGGGSARIAGADFMKAVWSLWFGNMDQPGLGDAMISKL